MNEWINCFWCSYRQWQSWPSGRCWAPWLGWLRKHQHPCFLRDQEDRSLSNKKERSEVRIIEKMKTMMQNEHINKNENVKWEATYQEHQGCIQGPIESPSCSQDHGQSFARRIPNQCWWWWIQAKQSMQGWQHQKQNQSIDPLLGTVSKNKKMLMLRSIKKDQEMIKLTVVVGKWLTW